MTSEVDKPDSILEQALNDALWCLPDVKGAVRVDREKLAKIKAEAVQALTTYIDSVVEQVIGKDEPRDMSLSAQGKANIARRARNTMREQQRHRYEQMKGEE